MQSRSFMTLLFRVRSPLLEWAILCMPLYWKPSILHLLIPHGIMPYLLVTLGIMPCLLVNHRGRWHDGLPPGMMPPRVCMPHARVSALVQMTNMDITGNRKACGAKTHYFQRVFQLSKNRVLMAPQRSCQHSTKPGNVRKCECFESSELTVLIAMTLASTWYCATLWLIRNLNAHNLLINMCKKTYKNSFSCYSCLSYIICIFCKKPIKTNFCIAIHSDTIIVLNDW